MPTEELHPGPALDAIVAEKVCGWRWFGASLRGTPLRWIDDPADRHHLDGPIVTDAPDIAWRVASDAFREVPRYSTEMGAAWMVVEAIKSRGLAVGIWDAPTYSSVPCPLVKFKPGVYPPDRTGDGYCAFAATVPLCICRAALAAVEGLAECRRRAGERGVGEAPI